MKESVDDWSYKYLLAVKKIPKPGSEIIQDYADHFACNKLKIRIRLELIHYIQSIYGGR